MQSKGDELMQRLILVIVAGLISVEASSLFAAAERTSVALTVTASAKADRQLAESLIALVESNLLADESLSVVERRQINLAMQELALSRTRSADESLQLGKLVTADLLAMMELR